MSTSLHTGDANAIPAARVDAIADWLDAKDTLGMLLAAIGQCSEDQLAPWVERHGVIQEGDSVRFLACALAEAMLVLPRDEKPWGLTSLYRMFDADGELLYIGRTARPGNRWEYHRNTAFWWLRVTTITVEHFLTRDEASVAELDAIAKERPTFNVKGQQPGYPPYSG